MKGKLVDAFISLLGAFGVFYPLESMENFWFGLIFGIIAAASIGLIVWFALRNAREVTIPEALAYGYYASFLEPMVSQTGNEAVINVNGQTKRFPGRNISFRIILPASLDSFGETIDKMQEDYQTASITVADTQKPFGIYIDESDDSLEIVDVPNTIRSLIVYLKRQGKMDPGLKKKKLDKMRKTVLEDFEAALHGVIDAHNHIDVLRKRVKVEQGSLDSEQLSVNS